MTANLILMTALLARNTMTSGSELLRSLTLLAQHHDASGKHDAPLRVSAESLKWMTWHRDPVKQAGFHFGPADSIYYGQHPIKAAATPVVDRSGPRP